MVSDDIMAERGWRNSRILKAATPGLGKLTASLAYSGGSPGSKEVSVGMVGIGDLDAYMLMKESRFDV